MKLHLGCGERYIKGYIHIDIDDLQHIDYKTSINDLSMIENESCDLIYASHVLEYFDFEDANEVLLEWKSKLKKGGTLRISVPNLESLILIYGKTKEVSNILGPLYGKWSIDGDNIYHKTIYDKKSLQSILENNGYKGVREWDWRKELPKGYDDYSIAYFPHMDTDNGIQLSLNLECEKS